MAEVFLSLYHIIINNSSLGLLKSYKGKRAKPDEKIALNLENGFNMRNSDPKITLFPKNKVILLEQICPVRYILSSIQKIILFCCIEV